MARGAIVGGLLLVAVAAAAFFVLRPGEPEGVSGADDAGPAATTGAADGAGLAARGPRPAGGKTAAKGDFAGRIVGRVLDEGGRPAAGVRVTAMRDGDGNDGRPVEAAQRDEAARERLRRRLEAFDAPGV